MSKHKHDQQTAKDYTKGVISQLLVTAFSVILWVMVYQVVINTFNWRIDPTDKSGWSRSDLTYYVDHGTGIEYVGTKNGGMMERGTGHECE